MLTTPRVTLGDVCKVISGYAFKSAAFKTGGSTPVIKIKNIKIGSASLDDVGYVDEDFVDKINAKFIVRPNDILISLTGSHMNQPNSVVGRVGRYPNNYPLALLNQRAGKIIPNKERIDSTYLFYVLLGDELRREIAQMASGAASQANISPSQVESITIPLPTMDNQIKIGSLLQNYDNLIENNNRRIAILEDMAQSLYREWFVNFRYPDHEDNLDADGDPKLVDSPLGQIPEGWGVKKIKDLGTVITGKTPSKKKAEYYASSDVPFLKTPDMHGASFSVDIADYLSDEGANSQKNKFIPADSICVACIGAKAGVVILTSEKLQTNQQINSLVLDDPSMREYFYLFAVGLHQKIHALGSSGATMTNVSKSKFEGIEVIVPPTSIIEDFHKATGASFDLILNLQKRNKNLKSQRDMLLPKLISGDMTV